MMVQVSASKSPFSGGGETQTLQRISNRKDKLEDVEGNKLSESCSMLVKQSRGTHSLGEFGSSCKSKLASFDM